MMKGMEMEKASCSQVKWVLPTANTKSASVDRLFGRFEFEPSKGKKPSFRRHILIESTGMSDLWNVKVNEIIGVGGLGKTVADRNEHGSIYSIMSKMQDQLVYELISYLGG